MILHGCKQGHSIAGFGFSIVLLINPCLILSCLASSGSFQNVPSTDATACLTDETNLVSLTNYI